MGFVQVENWIWRIYLFVHMINSWYLTLFILLQFTWLLSSTDLLFSSLVTWVCATLTCTCLHCITWIWMTHMIISMWVSLSWLEIDGNVDFWFHSKLSGCAIIFTFLDWISVFYLTGIFIHSLVVFIIRNMTVCIIGMLALLILQLNDPFVQCIFEIVHVWYLKTSLIVYLLALIIIHTSSKFSSAFNNSWIGTDRRRTCALPRE